MPTLDLALAEAARVLLGDARWRGTPDALAAALRDAAAHGHRPRARWRNAAHARRVLDHAEAARYWTGRLRDCPPNVLIQTAWALRRALRAEGPTGFDLLADALARGGVTAA